ncbi:hypothetical protein [Shewanella dokdonensis]|uniref:hypothetical protein n=1 Tax=Shewanella dokdonensis TaxID=712036 RepID=UPI001FD376BD|nr:hypothetical protein [Shewanella dokdonensis]
MPTLDQRVATALLVAGTMFMEMLDATVITTALPAIAGISAPQPPIFHLVSLPIWLR